jgi:fructose 5-dehydrogenase small subunit
MSGKRARPGPGTGIVVPASGRFDRRAFMQGSTALATALLFTGFDLRPATAEPLPAPAGPGQLTQDEFMRLSAFLTSHDDLKPEVGARIFRSYAPGSPENRQLADLYTGIRSAGVGSVDAWLASSGFRDTTLSGPAVAVVAAWYLGFVGQGERAQLVTFEDALMFAPTADVLPVPTFCQTETGAWAAPPPGAGQSESMESQTQPPADQPSEKRR